MYKLPFGITITTRGNRSEVCKQGVVIGGYTFDITRSAYVWESITGEHGKKELAKECINMISNLAPL